jgi:hypothetical protein
MVCESSSENTRSRPAPRHRKSYVACASVKFCLSLHLFLRCTPNVVLCCSIHKVILIGKENCKLILRYGRSRDSILHSTAVLLRLSAFHTNNGLGTNSVYVRAALTFENNSCNMTKNKSDYIIETHFTNLMLRSALCAALDHFTPVREATCGR